MRQLFPRMIPTLVVVIACGGHGATKGTQPGRGAGSGSAAHTPPNAGAEAPAAPTDAECGQLLAHVVELTLHEHAPAGEPVTDAERQRVVASVEPLRGECAKLSRATYRCAIGATSLANLVACQPAPQATRSSSTSNSSVAPGGITPAAPDAP